MYVYGSVYVEIIKKKILVASIALSRGRGRTCNRIYYIVYVSWTAHMTSPVFIFWFFIILLLPPRIRRRSRLMDGRFLLRCSTTGHSCVVFRTPSVDDTTVRTGCSDAHTPGFCFGSVPGRWGCVSHTRTVCQLVYSVCNQSTEDRCQDLYSILPIANCTGHYNRTHIRSVIRYCPRWSCIIWWWVRRCYFTL